MFAHQCQEVVASVVSCECKKFGRCGPSLVPAANARQSGHTNVCCHNWASSPKPTSHRFRKHRHACQEYCSEWEFKRIELKGWCTREPVPTFCGQRNPAPTSIRNRNDLAPLRTGASYATYLRNRVPGYAGSIPLPAMTVSLSFIQNCQDWGTGVYTFTGFFTRYS